MRDAACYALFATPIGAMGIVWSPRGVACIALPEGSEDATRRRIQRRFTAAHEEAPPPAIDAAIGAIRALLHGEPRDLSGIALDLEAVPELHRRIYAAARTIPPGRTLSYGELAARVGDKALAREVGVAMARNPFSVVVPCHRVLAADGKLGGFSARGGTATKLRLLSIEGVQMPGTTPLFAAPGGAGAASRVAPVTKRRVLVSWSSGKDSAWMLRSLRADPSLELVGLLTTLNDTFGRVAMHGVPDTLLARQADALGLPLWRIPLPWPCSNDEYEARMRAAIARARSERVDAIAFGDLFLADVRAYRERMLSGTGIAPLFPLFGADTARLAREMIAGGLRATLACVDTAKLDARFAGRAFDAQLLGELPPGVDPCGENGEFHTFAWDGPMFARPVPIARGGVVVRDGFAFADLS